MPFFFRVFNHFIIYNQFSIMEKMGIVQLSYFVRFFGGLVAIIIAIIQNGKVSLLKDIRKLFRLLTFVKPLFSNFGQVWDEFRDLSETEKVELQTLVSNELGLDSLDASAAQMGVEIALTILQFISTLKKA